MDWLVVSNIALWVGFLLMVVVQTGPLIERTYTWEPALGPTLSVRWVR